MELSVPCKVCDRGSLSNKRIHRMSGPAVVIGYIFLIPSVLGIAISVIMFAVPFFQTSTDVRAAIEVAFAVKRDTHLRN